MNKLNKYKQKCLKYEKRFGFVDNDGDVVMEEAPCFACYWSSLDECLTVEHKLPTCDEDYFNRIPFPLRVYNKEGQEALFNFLWNARGIFQDTYSATLVMKHQPGEIKKQNYIAVLKQGVRNKKSVENVISRDIDYWMNYGGPY